jgi:excisionase family DNA binding protein
MATQKQIGKVFKNNRTAAAALFAAYPKDFMTAREVAEVLGVSPAAVYKRVQRISIPVTTVCGRRLLFYRPFLRVWAQNRLDI